MLIIALWFYIILLKNIGVNLILPIKIYLSQTLEKFERKLCQFKNFFKEK